MKRQVYFKLVKTFDQDSDDRRIGHNCTWYYITKTVGLQHLDFDDPIIGSLFQNRKWCIEAEQTCLPTKSTLDTFTEGKEDYEERKKDFDKIIESLHNNTNISINDIKGPCLSDDKGKPIVANIFLAQRRENSREYFEKIIDECIRKQIEVIFDYEDEWSPNKKENN